MSTTIKKRKQTTKSKARKKSLRKKWAEVAIHSVIPVEFDGWIVKNSRVKGFIFITDSKREAVKYARDVAKGRGEWLEIHEKDGKILKKRYRVRPSLRQFYAHKA